VKWNRKSLLRACEELIAREDFTVQLRTIDPKDATAHVNYEWNRRDGAHNIQVTLDPSQGGLIESLLHECLHVVLADEIGDRFNARLEEVLVKALEDELWRKAMKSPEVARWRSLIDRKTDDIREGVHPSGDDDGSPG
jgi:hypothetical protein